MGMETNNETTIEKFLNKLKEENKKDISVLIGNGLGKSHPVYKKAFEFDSKDILIEMNNMIAKDLSEENKRQTIICPEDFFKIYRIEFLIACLEHYIKSLDLETHYAYLKDSGLREFLKKFDKIFTTNYDPIIYWNIFDDDDQGFGITKTDFKDGFGKEDKSYENIENTLLKKHNEKKPIFFLHGAFHIFEKINDFNSQTLEEKKKNTSYKKLSFDTRFMGDKKRFILCQSQGEISTIKQNYNSENQKLKYDITCVMASKPKFKKAWIDDDPYLSLCFEELKKVKKLLIFGCSFRNNSHIVDALKKGNNIDKLYLCYKDSKARENLKQTFKDFEGKITWIDSSKIEEIIWRNS